MIVPKGEGVEWTISPSSQRPVTSTWHADEGETVPAFPKYTPLYTGCSSINADLEEEKKEMSVDTEKWHFEFISNDSAESFRLKLVTYSSC